MLFEHSHSSNICKVRTLYFTLMLESINEDSNESNH